MPCFPSASGVPRRRGLHIVRDDVFFFKANVISHPFRRSSFQIEPAALGFDLALGADLELVPQKCSRFPEASPVTTMVTGLFLPLFQGFPLLTV